MQQFWTSAFHTVVCWHKLGEVENEYTSEKPVLFAIFVPKIFTIRRNLAKLWQKISLHSFFWDTVYTQCCICTHWNVSCTLLFTSETACGACMLKLWHTGTQCYAPCLQFCSFTWWIELHAFTVLYSNIHCVPKNSGPLWYFQITPTNLGQLLVEKIINEWPVFRFINGFWDW